MGSRWILVVGGSSDIGFAVARRFCREGYNAYLTFRDPDKYKEYISDIETRFGVRAKALKLDITDEDDHKILIGNLDPIPEVVIMAVGYLNRENTIEEVKRTLEVNYFYPVIFLEKLWKILKPGSTIIGISSVAGDRVKQSNYVYGSAKAGFSGYLEGLNVLLYKRGIRVINVKPGFVRTKMIEGLEVPNLLTADPEDVAEDIFKAFLKKKDVVYTRWFWRYIMLAIKLIPGSLWKRLNL